MRAVLRVLMAVLILMAALPAVAASGGSKPSEGFQPAVLSSATAGGQFQPVVALDTGEIKGEIKRMTLGQAAAIIGGAIVGGTVADFLLNGTLYTLIGVVVGAALGSEWYDQGMWPWGAPSTP
jgi:hypothetical protein